MHTHTVVVFEFSDTEGLSTEATGIINVTVTHIVATATPINLTVTPTEYSEEFGFFVVPVDTNIAARMSIV